MESTPPASTSAPKTSRLTLALRIIVGLLSTGIAVAAAVIGYWYAVSPAVIRHPQGAHYHFRLQIINNGTPVNFADAKYQTPLNTDICTVALTHEPIHFHDQLDQFVHIHWSHLTGGLVLKNYGWNFIGGPSGLLGYRFDQLPRLLAVPIHGRVLPQPASGAHYYVYTGTDEAYQLRVWQDFLNQDLADFLANRPAVGFWQRLVPTATAHGDDAKLTQLNDVRGNVVIFVQPKPPTPSQVKDRFKHLVPLPESTCGG